MQYYAIIKKLNETIASITKCDEEDDEDSTSCDDDNEENNNMKTQLRKLNLERLREIAEKHNVYGCKTTVKNIVIDRLVNSISNKLLQKYIA